jgi:hypothetical protein
LLCSRAFACLSLAGLEAPHAGNDCLRECRSPSSSASPGPAVRPRRLRAWDIPSLLPFFYRPSCNQSYAANRTATLVICHSNQVPACSLGTSMESSVSSNQPRPPLLTRFSIICYAYTIFCRENATFRIHGGGDRRINPPLPLRTSRRASVSSTRREPACSHGRGQTLFLSPCLYRQ